MKSIRLLILIFSASLCHANDRIPFGKMGAHDEIEIVYRSMGCFHSVTYKFIFTQGGVVRFWEREFDLAESDPEWGWGLENQLRFIGGLKLSNAELEQLDRLIGFLKENRDDGCTTLSTLDLRYRRDGYTIGFDKITDESCSEMGYDTNFWTIAYNIKETEKENK